MKIITKLACMKFVLSGKEAEYVIIVPTPKDKEKKASPSAEST